MDRCVDGSVKVGTKGTAQVLPGGGRLLQLMLAQVSRLGGVRSMEVWTEVWTEA